MHLPSTEETRGDHMRPREVRPNEATLDHLFSRVHPSRARDGSKHPVVLACWWCNQQRCRKECQAAQRQELTPNIPVAVFA